MTFKRRVLRLVCELSSLALFRPAQPQLPPPNSHWPKKRPEVSQARARGVALRNVLVTVTAIAAGVIIILSLRSPPVQPKPDPATTQAPDITALPQVQGSRALNNLGAGEGLFITMADKQDPTRIAGQLQAAKSTPLEGKRYAMQAPRVWLYLRDGRTLYIEADSGRALFPDFAGSRPEDGLIEGNVRMRLFAPTKDGLRPDPALAPPALTLTCSELTFDLRIGEIRFPTAVRIIGDRIDFDGSNALLVLNEPTGTLELLRVAHTRKLTYFPEKKAVPAAAPLPRGAGVPTASSTQPSPPAPTPPASAPAISHYSISASTQLTITQAARSLSAESLIAYVRLIGGKLPDLSPTRTTAAPPPAPHSQPRLVAVAFSPAQPQPAVSPTTDAVYFQFTGPLEVKLLRSSPSQLAGTDSLFVLCTSTPPSLTPSPTPSSQAPDSIVTLQDTQQGVLATAYQVSYSAPSRKSTLEGTAALPAKVARVNVSDSAAAFASSQPLSTRRTTPGGTSAYATALSFEVLPAQGLVLAHGAGSLHSDSAPGTAASSISWQEDARFAFVLENSEFTSCLTSVHLRGSVVASNGPAQDNAPTLRGDDLLATFVPIDRSSSYLSSLRVRGNTRATGDPGQSLAANALDVTFIRANPADAAGTKSEPSLLKASGAVVATQADATLSAANIEATLGRAPSATANDAAPTSQKLEVLHAVATTDVRFDRADGLWALSPHMVAKPREQLVTLSGPASAVGQLTTKIEGNTIAMNGLARTLAVQGPGKFQHSASADGASQSPSQTALATWSAGMLFDDLSGTVTCDGSADVSLLTGTPPNLAAKDRLVAQRVVVQLEPPQPTAAALPSPNSATSQPEGLLAGAASSNRRVSSLLAKGSDTPPIAPASVELRRYTLGSADPVLNRLLYLEGMTIFADNLAGTLSVPTPGKLLSIDATAAAPQTLEHPRDSAAQTPQRGSVTAKGTALFSWDQDFIFDRTRGEATLRGMTPAGVRLIHESATDGLRSELECRTLIAKIDAATQAVPAAGGDSGAIALDQPFSGEFKSALASGSVWLRSRARELTADNLTYDALTGLVDASAQPGNLVQLSNPGSATPINASGIMWNLRDDAIRILNAQPIVSPR